MEDQVLELEGESLEDVRAQAKAKTPPGQRVLSEKVLSDGNIRTVEGLADTAAEAAALARKKVPAEAGIVGEKLKISAERKTLEVEAWDEAGAETKIKAQIPGTNRVESIVQKAAGRKGVLGIGKTPNAYSAAVFQPAVFEVSYKGKARIRVEIGERKYASSGHCQNCGRADAPAKAGDKEVHYFCGPGCSEPYFKAKLRSLLSNASIINFSGRDISGIQEAGRAASALDRAHCWFCGRELPMADKKCSSCGREQDVAI